MAIPLCAEVIVVLVLGLYPSCVEVIVVLALYLASCVEVVVSERRVVYSNFVITNSSEEVPFMGGPV